MDWNAAIEKNREALKRVLAALVAMAELGGQFYRDSPDRRRMSLTGLVGGILLDGWFVAGFLRLKRGLISRRW